ncbi:MAG: serine acetyltransferase [Fastidiosipilaceae bacterium]|jgi:serine O-acetyltransferase
MCFEDDLFRFYGRKEKFFEKIKRPLELKYIYWFRHYQSSKYDLLKIICMVRMRQISKQSGIQIPYKTRIGRGFYIGHTGTIIINEKVIIGDNCNISTGVTLGIENRGKRKGCPTIGDRVWIGTNAVIIGKVKIGNNVLIAPLSYVNFDVPDNSIVIGNPAKIIPSYNATEHYITNTVIPENS